MADRLWRAQVSIPLDSNVPEDAIINTWHFDDDDDPVAAPDDTRDWIMSKLTDFYQAIDGVVFPVTVEGPAQVRLYDLRQPEPRVPVFTETIDLVTTADQPLPNEVALCLSFKAADQSGVPTARRRGRLFLGPIAESQVSVIASQARPSLAMRQAVAAAAGDMVDGFLHPGSPDLHLKWSIYSRRTDVAGTLDDSFNDVIGGWVDDAFDTQRRRGATPTARVTF